MAGQVHRVLQDYYQRVGIDQDNLVNRLKQRNIRIQLCLNSVDLSRFNESSDDAPEDVAKVEDILSRLPVGVKVGKKE